MYSKLFAISAVGVGLASAIVPVPPAYNTGHPRLPHPDNAWLLSLAGNSTAIGYYNNSANAWNPLVPGSMQRWRRLLIAYLANKAAGNTATATAQLALIENTINGLGGLWGARYFSVTDGVTTGSSQTVTSASADFLNGCSGSCLNKLIAIDNVGYKITGITDAHTISSLLALSANYPSNPPADAAASLIVVSTNFNTDSELLIAIAFDWIYSDLSSTTRSNAPKFCCKFCIESTIRVIGPIN